VKRITVLLAEYLTMGEGVRSLLKAESDTEMVHDAVSLGMPSGPASSKAVST
jgi:hypothetical protein